ncbi:MAG TPA: hypothetical protein VK812_06530 [Candidatus Binatus sp.]|jgi:hypothetical protein|nr:hypothetical protein [Candidatus Binatus sp.]
MIRPGKSASPIAVALIILFLTLSAGCGSSSHNNLSAAQAQAVSQEVDVALQAALTNAFSTGQAADTHPSLAAIAGDLTPDQLSCVTSASGTTCNIPVTYSGPCPGGGTIGVSGDFDFTLNNAGDGSDNSTLTITPTNCSVSNETINGDPNITVATQINFTNDAPVFPITLTETGGISFGPNPSGSCTVNETLTITSATSCTKSGNFCGRTLSGSC